MALPPPALAPSWRQAFEQWLAETANGEITVRKKNGQVVALVHNEVLYFHEEKPAIGEGERLSSR